MWQLDHKEAPILNKIYSYNIHRIKDIKVKRLEDRSSDIYPCKWIFFSNSQFQKVD
jgi:hypothetical protein